jgi:hypothetical protein
MDMILCSENVYLALENLHGIGIGERERERKRE